MKKTIFAILIVLLVFAITACGKISELPIESTVPTETQTDLPAETEATEFVQTEPVETEPPTEPPTEPAEVLLDPAQEILSGIRFFINESECTLHLTDKSYYSSMRMKTTDVLTITSETPFASIYFQWDFLPGAYSIIWETGNIEAGEVGFLHEYVTLDQEVTAVDIVFHSENTKSLSELSVYTEGTTPEGVQIWKQPYDKADILVFPTHADDEALFFGPLIAYYTIERQLAVQTAFMVEHVVQPCRAHERINSLWELGIRHYPILYNAPDMGMATFSEAYPFYASSKIPDWQVEQIRRFQPLVVVGHDLEGEYGNGGHIINAYYLVTSIVDAANPEMYPESAELYGVWDTPKLYIHLYPENEWYFDVNTPMVNDPEGRTPFEVAEVAYAMHLSQHQYTYRVQQNDLVRSWDCRPFGLYRSLVGQDTTADVMENIDPAQWRTE